MSAAPTLPTVSSRPPTTRHSPWVTTASGPLPPQSWAGAATLAVVGGISHIPPPIASVTAPA